MAPDLPAGLNLDRDSGVISGTPDEESPKKTYKCTVEDSASPPVSATTELELQVKAPQQGSSTGTASPTGKGLAISTTSLPPGTAGKPYEKQLQAVGGSGALVWSVQGALPSGITLDAVSGTLGGTPDKPFGEASLSFTVTDSASPPSKSTRALKLRID